MDHWKEVVLSRESAFTYFRLSMSAQSLPANVKNEYLALGLYQIFGGVIGLFYLAVFLLRDFNSTSSQIIMSIGFLLLYTYGVLCGSLCLKKYQSAVRHTVVNQALQIVWFAIFGVCFKYGTGLYLVVGLDLTESLNVVANLGISNFEFSYNSGSEAIVFGLNIVAFWVMQRAIAIGKFLEQNVT